MDTDSDKRRDAVEGHTEGASIRAQELLEDAFCCDLHGCMPVRPDDVRFLPQLERYRRAGVNLVFLNIGWDIHSVEEQIRMLASFRSWLRDHKDKYEIVSGVAALPAATAAGRLTVGFDIEGMNAVARQPELVDLYYDLGVRWMLIAYNRNNPAGCGCQDTDGGLTDFGRAVIERMARVGMLLCCSHTGKRTTLEAIKACPNPVIFSHSNPSAVHPHARNIDDETIRACAARGGLIGINGIGRFLGHNDNRSSTYVEHVDYVVQLVGAEHVGIGLDYVFDTAELMQYVARYPEIYPPEQFRDGYRLVQPEQLPEIVEGLLRRGYAESAIRQILGGNILRVARQVWR